MVCLILQLELAYAIKLNTYLKVIKKTSFFLLFAVNIICFYKKAVEHNFDFV